MLNEEQIRRVWEGKIGSETRSNYFAELSGDYVRKQSTATWLTLVASSGAAVSIITALPAVYSWVRFALALASVAISLYSVVMQNQKLAVDASDLHSRWNKLGKDYQRLWENVYADDALSKLDALDDRSVDLSKTGVIFPNRKRRMLHWQDHVLREQG